MKAEHFSERLFQALQAAGSEANAAPMAAYMKHKFDYFGVKSPERKSILSGLIKEHGMPNDESFEETIHDLWESPYREMHYCGMELFHQKKWWRHESSIALIEHLIQTHSWWDTVDFIASNICGSYFKSHPQHIKPKVNSWNASSDMWLIRSSILFQLKYKSETDYALLEKLIAPHVSSNEFFIQKAIGWALRQASKDSPAFTRRMVEQFSLKPVSLREAVKYI